MIFKLTRIQLFLILFYFETGVIYISFQQKLIKEGGRDAWMMFTSIAIITYFLLLFYEKYYRYFIVGVVTSWLYIFYWLLIIVSFLSYLQFTLNAWVIQNTPSYVTIFAIVLISAYINASRPSTIVNLGVLMIPLVVVFVVFILLATHELRFSNILPLGTSTMNQWIAGLNRSFIPFIGIESYLLLRNYVLKGEKISGMPLFIFHFIVSVFLGASVIGTEFYFVMKEMDLIHDPIIYILKSQQVTFVKRLDIFFVYIWMAWSIITINLYLFMIRIVLFTKKKRYSKVIMYILYGVIILGSLFSLNITPIEFIREYLVYTFYPFAIILPIFIIWWNKRREFKCE